ncbi:DUF7285 family protein [Haloprofundus halophilus]|uniref:DUF7285 family protein n=1 Tax=Haloprofundus halophilus TaxID=2283527 RepID=UPI000E43AD45|nr:hypothetical protein [Haloprofundus halophilus]
MLRSSARDGNGAGRAQTDPTTALVAVFAVVVSLSLYAVVFDGARPSEARALADPTLERVTSELTEDAVVDPAALDGTRGAAPDGYSLNVSLAVGERRWTVGPPVPTEWARAARRPGFDEAARRPSVRLRPGVVRPGRLRVAVWR